ncbi:hypothetical protein KQX54_003897 [Cotesia glomerata]|uniref:Uncharacterized protein n=1 Tax=Cotesia glomerata TaxID=32391 RepID=A0AAV7HUK9_COTGL|nr:hypothetical protein KQX54_003897 [Cotesia glomerata]
MLCSAMQRKRKLEATKVTDTRSVESEHSVVTHKCTLDPHPQLTEILYARKCQGLKQAAGGTMCDANDTACCNNTKESKISKAAHALGYSMRSTPGRPGCHDPFHEHGHVKPDTGLK